MHDARLPGRPPFLGPGFSWAGPGGAAFSLCIARSYLSLGSIPPASTTAGWGFQGFVPATRQAQASIYSCEDLGANERIDGHTGRSVVDLPWSLRRSEIGFGRLAVDTFALTSCAAHVPQSEHGVGLSARCDGEKTEALEETA